MPKLIQLRQVPDELHRKLKTRAALELLLSLLVFTWPYVCHRTD